MGTGRALSVRVVDVIRELAEERGDTQTTLGLRSSLGQPQISRLYRGRAHLKLDELDALCQALDVSILDVLDRALHP